MGVQREARQAQGHYRLWSEKGALCSCPGYRLPVTGYRLPGYRYEAGIYADAPDDAAHPMNTAIGERTVDRTAKLKVHLAPGGGAAIRIRPSGN